MDVTASTTASSSDEKMESDASTSQTKSPATDDSSVIKMDDSLTPTPTDISMTSTDLNTTFGSGMTAEMTEHEMRKNLIKDIESHIEIIFECIEEDDDEDDEKRTAAVRVGVAAESPAIVGLLKSAEPLIKNPPVLPPAASVPVVEATPVENTPEQTAEAVDPTSKAEGKEEPAAKEQVEEAPAKTTPEEAGTVEDPTAADK
jgi:hypothetical protein